MSEDVATIRTGIAGSKMQDTRLLAVATMQRLSFLLFRWLELKSEMNLHGGLFVHG